MNILKRKKQLVESFEKQHNIVCRMNEDNLTLSEQEKFERKALLSDLSAIIEQLLVIDHENEKMLKNIMSSSGRASSGAGTFRERPALRPCLPFVPGASSASSAQPSPRKTARAGRGQGTGTSAPALSASSASELAYSAKNVIDKLKDRGTSSRPRARLKNYAQASQILQLASKYA
jgi:hypothetical protein